MFYIKPSYPYDNLSLPNKLFHAWLGNYSVTDNNNDLNFSGDYYIYSNANLPVGSYKLNFKTYFASATNIQLVFKENVMNKKIQDKNAFKIDKYYFSFNISTAESKFFDSYIIHKTVKFDIKPQFDVTILKNYEIDVTTEDLNTFLQNIEDTTNFNAFVYKNAYTLDEENQKINISLNYDERCDLYIDVNSFKNLTKPINHMFTINKLDNSPLVVTRIWLKMQYTVDNESKEFEWVKKDILNFYEKNIDININESLMFDKTSKEIIQFDGLKGLYLPNAVGSFTCIVDIEYRNQMRSLLLSRNFNFIQEDQEILNSVNIEDYTNTKQLIGEVQSEKIY